MPERGSPTFFRLLAEASRDLIDGLAYWRVWLHLGLSDIRQRYRRSIIGQNWQTLSIATFLGSILVIYSNLLNIEISTYGVHLVCAFSCWMLISSTITDSSQSFISAEGLMRHYNFPISIAVYQVIARNVAIFLHAVVLVVPTFLILGYPFSWTMLLIVPVVLIYAINGVWIGIVLGSVCARFRDVPQAVSSVVQILFVLTPVMYPVESIGGTQAVVVMANPVTQFLLLGRNVLMGQLPTLENWIYVLVITAIGLLFGVLVFARTRRRLIYWL